MQSTERKPTAIVVDDEPITRLDILQILEDAGFEILGSAGDGYDAAELCALRAPDLLVMDINMPLFDGLSTAEKLIREKLAECIVIVTGYGNRENAARAALAGVAGYVIKPVEQNAFLATVEIALAQTGRLRAKEEKCAELAEKLEAQKLIDRAKSTLAAKHGISEAAAYRELQKAAMDKRCSIAELAKRLVNQSGGKEIIDRTKQQLMEQGLSEKAAYSKITAEATRLGVTAEQAARRMLSAGERK